MLALSYLPTPPYPSSALPQPAAAPHAPHIQPSGTPLHQARTYFLPETEPTPIGHQLPPKRQPHGKPLDPMRMNWSKGLTALPYTPPADSANREVADMSLDELIKSQPRVPKNPFTTVDTRSHDVDSEYRKAADAGFRTLSLDVPNGSDETGLPLTLADLVSLAVELTAAAQPKPDLRFKIEAEKRAIANGEIIHVNLLPDGMLKITTRDRMTGKAQTELAKHYIQVLTTLWSKVTGGTRLPTPEERERGRRAIRAYVSTLRKPRIQIADPAFFAPAIEDEDSWGLHEVTHAEPVDPSTAQILSMEHYQGRGLEQLWPEEHAELQSMMLELSQAEDARERRAIRRSRPLPARRFHTVTETRGRGPSAHISEYIAGAEDIIG